MSLVERYKALNERERRLTLILSIVLVIGGFYWLIWSPINQSIQQNSQRVVAKQELLTFVRSSAATLQSASRSGSSKAFSGSLTQAVNSGASRFKISISRMQPQGDELQVWIDNVDFTQLLSWLSDLENKGVNIIVADIAESDIPGFVKVRRLQLGK